MAYSHSRLRKTLALVRIMTGTLFLFAGAHKVSSWEFARVEFPGFLMQATHGAAVGFYAEFLNGVVWDHPSRLAVLVGLTELFIGVGLVLGLAIRPVTVVGMVYTANLVLATWMAPGPDQPLWRYLDNEAKLLLLFFLLLLFAVGHAGENWGLGSLYHHRRHKKWESDEVQGSTPAPFTFEPYDSSARYSDFDDFDDSRVPWQGAPARDSEI